MKKTLQKTTDKGYNSIGSLASKKGVILGLDSQDKLKVSGTLVDDNGTWTIRARVYVPNKMKVVQRSKSTGLKVKNNTKRKAEQIMRDIVLKWEEESNAIIPKGDPTLSEYIQKWIGKKALSLKANSIKSYQEYADVHIIPMLGKLRIREMTLEHLQLYYSEKIKSLSVNSMKKHHVVINGAILDAVRDGIIPVNFATYVEFPKIDKFEGKAYTPKQVSILLESASKEGEPIYSAVILAVCYGLRRSEICGLRWEDINFDENIMNIKNTYTQNGNLFIEMERTKTKKSRRSINLLEMTVSYLLSLKQNHEWSGIGIDKVCRWPDGRSVNPNYITKKIPIIMERSGIEKIRLHDLRHTAATLLSMKASPKQVQEFLGHEDISTTMNVYTHLLSDARKETSNMMDDIFKSSVFCSEKCSE